MDRREALERVAWVLGGTIVGGGLFLEGCTREQTKTVTRLFDSDMIDLLGDIADAILPPTSTPGAKEAGVGEFIPVMVRDCYTAGQQKVVIDGLDNLDEVARLRFKKGFRQLKTEDQSEMIVAIDKEAREYQLNRKGNEPDHYFTLLRQLTLIGFFTSELGATKALRYVQIPGRYDGDYPYKKGDKAWAM